MNNNDFGRDSIENALLVLLTTASTLRGMADRLDKMAELIEELHSLSQDYNRNCQCIGRAAVFNFHEIMKYQFPNQWKSNINGRGDLAAIIGISLSELESLRKKDTETLSPKTDYTKGEITRTNDS